MEKPLFIGQSALIKALAQVFCVSVFLVCAYVLILVHMMFDKRDLLWYHMSVSKRTMLQKKERNNMSNVSSFGFERIVGKTPSGGRYCEIYYYCGVNEACAKEDATHCVIYEKKKNGTTINTIYCML